MVKLDFFPEPDSSTFNSFKENLRKYPLCLTEDPIMELVLKYKQDFSKVTVADPVSLEDLIHEKIELKILSYPKREILGEEFTDEDYEKLCKKLSLQNEQFKKHQIRDIKSKVERIKSTFSRLTSEEIFFALKELEYNEEEVMICLTKVEFVNRIRDQIAQIRNEKKPPKKSFAEKQEKEEEEEKEEEKESRSDSDNESDSENESFEDEVKENYNNNSSEPEEPEESEYKMTETIVSNKKRSASLNKKASRLRLDDALANVTDMEGWSEARIRAYQGMKTNPNAYFYRFNAPGETQKNGPWSKEEDELFMKRLKEFGAGGQWGIFSMNIPGRVGYQCSNYYRKLIETGRIKDSNYSLDSKGKAHYISGKTKSSTGTGGNKITQESESESEEESTEEPIATRAVKIANTTNTNNVIDDMPKGVFYENPLPGFIDAITQTEVIRPAISPYGHVLSYDTWLKCLLNGDRKNTCPLTNQPLHKRQLIFLTFDNISMYRDKIINGQ